MAGLSPRPFRERVPRGIHRRQPPEHRREPPRVEAQARPVTRKDP